MLDVFAADMRLSYPIIWSLMPPTASISLFSLLLYFGYRLKCLITAQQSINRRTDARPVDGGQSIALAWVFFALELLTLRSLAQTL